MSDGNDELTPQDVEREAREMGWRPQEEYKGDPSKWIPAEEFVERGQHVIPIMRATQKRLRQELEQRDQKLDTLAKQLESQNAAFEKIEKHYQEANKRAYEDARKQIKEEMKAAREAGDVDGEFEAHDRLRNLEAEHKAETKKVEEKEDPPNKDVNVTKYDPAFTAWVKKNPWFGGTSKEDRARTKEITRIAEDLREEGTELTGAEFFEECERILEARENGEDEGKNSRKASKVEGTPARGSNGRSGAKTFESLPKEAKDACTADAETFVGPNKRYKTLKEWQTKYAEIYYSTEG